jgi:hypothetical protein
MDDSELQQRLQRLTYEQLGKLVMRVQTDKLLTDKERVFVAEYVKRYNRRTAAEAAGYASEQASSWQILFGEARYKLVRVAIMERIAEVEAKATLQADYVRDYIYSILELCPTDYFTLGPDGEWMIDPKQFKELPLEVKRLVEGVEAKFIRGQLIFKVQFLSKTAALAMAARYTLTQKAEVEVKGAVPWDEIASAEKEAEDPIERRIADVTTRLEGSAPVSEGALAPRAILLPAEGDHPLGVAERYDGSARRAHAG